MSDHERFDDMRSALRATARGSSAREPRAADCLDDHAVAGLAEGSLDPDTREHALIHVSGCHACRTAVASVARALASPDIAHELSRPGPKSRVRLLALAMPAAAAAVLLLIVVPKRFDESVPPHRAAPINAAPAPAAVWPVGAVSSAPSLRWTSVSGADRYRVTLFAADGRVLFATELRDTVTVLPDSIRLAPGGAYWWRVEARTGFDRWAQSELIEFSIAGSGRR